VKDEDDTSGVKTEEDGEDVTEGRIWRLQAHARNSITAMKIDPVNGSGVSLSRACESKTNNQLFSSSYDCTLRHLDFSTLKSTELFAHSNDDMLITHFDLMPSGQQAWLADKNGGISFCDFREGQQERKRWVVQEEGRAAKLGGLSVNRSSSLSYSRAVLIRSTTAPLTIDSRKRPTSTHMGHSSFLTIKPPLNRGHYSSTNT
jgi:WD40 repeat protein